MTKPHPNSRPIVLGLALLGWIAIPIIIVIARSRMHFLLASSEPISYAQLLLMSNIQKELWNIQCCLMSPLALLLVGTIAALELLGLLWKPTRNLLVRAGFAILVVQVILGGILLMSIGSQGGIDYVDHLLVGEDDYRLLRLIDPRDRTELFTSSMYTVRGAWLLYECIDAGDRCTLVSQLNWSYLSYMLPSLAGDNIALTKSSSVIGIRFKDPSDFTELYRLDADDD